jgi:hypothetical protein
MCRRLELLYLLPHSNILPVKLPHSDYLYYKVFYNLNKLIRQKKIFFSHISGCLLSFKYINIINKFAFIFKVKLSNSEYKNQFKYLEYYKDK